VSLPIDQDSYGVALQDVSASTIRDTAVDATTGIISGYGGTIERTHVHAGIYGVLAYRNLTTIRNSWIDLDGAAPTVYGLLAATSVNDGTDTTVVADGLDITGSGSPGSVAVLASCSYAPAHSVDLTLTNSVIRGYKTTLRVAGGGPGHAHIVASYSDYDSAKNFPYSNPAESITQTNISNTGSAGFDMAYDDFLVPGGPLIDAGDPATPQGLDLGGHDLVQDGNGDGIARRDIGAYEAPGIPLVGGGPSGPGGGSGAPASGDSSATGDSVATGDAALPGAGAPLRDTLAPLVSGFTTSHKVFAVGPARTAVSASVRGTRFGYTLSESAKVVVKIQRARGGRTVGKLIRSAKVGANTLRFSGRIGRKALRPGRYGAVITATDAAGNRSAPRRLSFRVVRG
jgi:hypothetical protein